MGSCVCAVIVNICFSFNLMISGSPNRDLGYTFITPAVVRIFNSVCIEFCINYILYFFKPAMNGTLMQITKG